MFAFAARSLATCTARNGDPASEHKVLHCEGRHAQSAPSPSGAANARPICRTCRHDREWLPGLSLGFWTALWAPAGTPAAIVDTLNASANRVMG
jgi:hypothetical protein